MSETIITGAESYGGLPAGSTPTDKRVDFLFKVAKLAPFAVFLKHLPKGKSPQSEKIEYAARQYMPHTIVVAAGGGIDASATTLNVATGTGKRVVAGDVLQNPLTRETILVGSISTDALTIVRSLGTDSGVIANSQTLFILGNVQKNGGGIPAARRMATTWDYNLLQQIKRSWEVEGRLDRLGAEEARGKGRVYKDARAEKMQEQLRELELSLFLGQMGIYTADGNRRTFMAGLEEKIVGADSDRTFDFGGAPTWASLESMGDQAFSDTDATELFWFCSGVTISALNEYHINKVAPNKYWEDKLGTMVKSIQLTDGKINLVREHWFKGDLGGYGFLVDNKSVRMSELQKTSVHDHTQTDEEDVERGFVEWEGTTEIRHPERLLMTTGITRSA